MKTLTFIPRLATVKQPPVTGELIEIPDFEQFQFVLHKGIGGWRVSEASSGGTVSENCASDGRAIEVALQVLRKSGKDEVIRVIAKVVEDNEFADTLADLEFQEAVRLASL